MKFRDLVLGTAMLVVGFCAHAAEFSFTAIEDTFVQKNKPTENFGGVTPLLLKQYGNTFERTPFLKFDLTALGSATNVVSARLRLYTEALSDDGAGRVDAWAVDNSWSASTITWSNTPPLGSLISTGWLAATGWFEVDVTPYITNAGIVSIVVTTPVGGTPSKFTSTEGASNHPVLVVNTGVVSTTNRPPEFSADPITAPDAARNADYSATLAGYASDPDFDELTFWKSGGNDWLQVAADGALSGTPTSADLDLNTFDISVHDGQGGTNTTVLRITVVNTPPEFQLDYGAFFSDPATLGSPYSGSIAGMAADANSDVLTYTKTTGSDWLILAANGTLSGTPSVANLGPHEFTVTVEDGNGGADTARMIIAVADSAKTPFNGTNVLFIAIDDCKPLFHCYGDPLAVTPNIDRLADGGTVFLNSHCQWSVCGPSRASLMTSLMPEETGVMGFKNMRGILPGLTTIPQHFRSHGYETGARGKLNDPRCVGNPDPDSATARTLNGRQIDDVLSWSIPYLANDGGYSSPTSRSCEWPDIPDAEMIDGAVALRGVELMQTMAAGDKPFFLGVGFYKPHVAWYANKRHWDMYDRADFERASFTNRPFNAIAASWKEGTEVHDKWDVEGTWPDPIDPDKQLELIHSYYACVSMIDSQIGLLMDEMDALGLSSNTVVVLWGDHGYHLGDHNQWGKHTNMEQGTRTPLIISSPFLTNAVPGVSSPVGFLDFFPTLCEMANLPLPEQPMDDTQLTGRPLKGVSLVPLLTGESKAVRQGILSIKGNYAFRTERYRYIEQVSGDTVIGRDLYDYVNDPLETVNLAGEPGYEALVYQYSKAIRTAPESPGCYNLMAAPPLGIPAQRTLPALDGTIRSNSSLHLSWPGVTNVQYNIMVSTNLQSGAWSAGPTSITGGTIEIAADNAQAFYRVEVAE
ncbi:sulfatase-like hydrolase/transferase [Pontiella sulfatireligans]|uniref:Choline-sulfatase n=1 Tax=Pontiella sulfatireligans TaxID=2750658 RepID=A0A6C2UD06_9BACT|nr:sulfatase-like hydrolase/transferase [Pontiella sulfatireligans]SPS74123.1 sulfatase S1_7 [Kiritimatiellales bacterium]VGO18030.1 Choline-sulfatase [Pontiella sulfatireligans]